MRKFLVLVALSCQLGAKEPNEFAPIASPNIEIGVSSLIGGCVNAITGAYIEHHCDLTVVGPEPLTFERTHVSSDPAFNLAQGWRHNHTGHALCSNIEYHGERELKLQYVDPRGYGATYVTSGPGIKLSHSLNPKGVTNCCLGEIGAKTNLKNFDLRGSKSQKETIVCTTASGATQRLHKEGEIDNSDIYFLMSEERLNKHRIDYERASRGRLKEVRLGRLKGDVPYSWIKANGFSNSSTVKHQKYLLEASDGRSVTYKLTGSSGHGYRIEEVIADHLPGHRYVYDSREGGGKLIFESCCGKDRVRQIAYFNKKDTDSSSDFRINRVKQVKAAVGQGGEMVPIHSFEYKAEIVKKKHEDPEVTSGKTYVYDAYEHKSIYHYDTAHRLTAIERFYGNRFSKQLFCRQRFEWGSKGELFGHLLSSQLEDSSGRAIKTQRLHYDLKGNVVLEETLGHIGQPNDCYQKRFIYDKHNRLIQQTEDNGSRFNYTYETRTDLVTSKFLQQGDQIARRHFYTYDSDGVLVQTLTDNGVTPDASNLTGVTEQHITLTTPSITPYGVPQRTEHFYLDLASNTRVRLKRIDHVHNLKGELLEQRIYDGQENLLYQLAWNYDAHGNITQETNALGHTTRRRYNEMNELEFEKTPDGTEQYHFYDRAGRLIETRLLDGKESLTNQYHYDYLNQRTRSIDFFGNETRYDYDEFGRVIAEIHPTIYDLHGQAIVPIVRKEYDLMGNVTAVTDPLGHTTRTTYNIFGKPLSIHYPDGTHESFEYLSHGRLHRSKAKNGLITIHTWDSQDRLLTKESYSSEGELLNRLTNTYDALHLLSSTDAEGIVTTYQYDQRGHLISKQMGDSLTTYEYDDLGRILHTYEWYDKTHCRKISKQWDYADHVIEERIEEDAKVMRLVRYAYDAVGNVIAETHLLNGKSATTYTAYNGRKQPIRITDPEGHTTHITYGQARENGQTVLETTMTDPLGNQTITTYNALQQISAIKKRNRMGDLIDQKRFFYDAAGQKIHQIDTVVSANSSRTIHTSWIYNASKQLIQLTEAVNTPEVRTTYYHYNSQGQQDQIIQPNGTILYHTYDAIGRLSQLTAKDLSYHYTYNANDQLIHIHDAIANTATQRVYDTNGRLASETLATGLTVSYVYDAFGRATQIILPDQSHITYHYDACHLTQVTRNNYTHTYQTFDPTGNVCQTKHIGNVGTTTYGYTQKGHLSTIQSTHLSQKIQHDAAGNVIQKWHNGEVSQYNYDDLYQLTSESGRFNHTYACDSHYNCIQKDETPRLFNALHQLIDEKYDANGNLLSGDYQYDALNRLISVTQGDQRTLYTYDSFNRRLSKQKQTHQKTWKTTSQQNFIYIGQNEVGSLSNGKITELRILGTGKGAEIGAAVALELHGKLYAPLHDHNGNVTLLIDAQTGTPVESYHYTAFGEEQILDAHQKPKKSSINPWRFSSKRLDEETGWVYFGRRYYDPKKMRWTTPDPLGYTAGPNLYAYVMNNPLMHIDLYGLAAQVSSGRTCSSSGQPPSSGPNLLTHILTLPGRIIYFIGRELMPIPIIDHIVKSIGYLFAGQPSHCQSILHESHSQSTVRGTQFDQHPNGSIIMENGIVTAQNELTDRCEQIANAICMQVHAAWNASHGGAADLLECFAQAINISTHSVDEAYKLVKKELQRIGTQGKLALNGHSQGGLVIRRLLGRLTASEKAQIHVFTYGTAKVIFAEDYGLAGAVNCISTRDAVPFVVDPIGCIRGWWRNDGSVEFVQSQGKPFIDHHFDNGIYNNKAIQYNREFKKNLDK